MTLLSLTASFGALVWVFQEGNQGITEGLVRISAGIEDIEDLKDDLTQALDAI